MAKKKTDKHTDVLNPSGPRVIRITCDGAACIDWHTIKPLQGKYKDRTDGDIQKIVRSIIKRGWAFPAHVSKIGKDIWAIDTHGRLLAAAWLEKNGWTIPPVPVNWIHAKTKAEAKDLLLVADSRYGKINREGFLEFIQDIEINMDELSLPDITVTVDGEEKVVKYQEKIELIIGCENENQAAELYGEFKERGLTCRISML